MNITQPMIDCFWKQIKFTETCWFWNGSLDRIDNERGYWKDNIKLSSFSEQGQNRRTTKLKKEDVIYIRNSYQNREKTQKELAIIFNISEVSICNIINRKRWKNI